jgi:protein SCO1/2
VNRGALVTALALTAFAAGLLVARLLPVPGAPGAAAPSAVPGLERPRVRGEFALTDPGGRRVPWTEIGGRRQLVFFGFTNCPDACPTTLARATQALDALGEDGKDMRVVLVSVDPDRDTPEVVGRYVAGFGPRAVGYTGDAASVDAAAAAFGVFREKLPPMPGGAYMVNHSAALFLLGADDTIVEIIPFGATVEEIAAAVRRHD